MDCNTSGFPVLNHLPDLAQTHVHWVGHAIQPSRSVIPFSSCLQSFPPSGSFPVSWLFTSGWRFSISPSSEHSGLISLWKGAVPSVRDWARPPFECLSASCRGTGQQCPAPETGLWLQQNSEVQHVAYILLEEVAISPSIELTHRLPTNWRTPVPKKCSHYCKSSGAHSRFPNLGSSKGTENPQGSWLWRTMVFDYRTSTGLGKLRTLRGHK